MPSTDLLSLFDAGQRLGLESVEVLRLARNGELGLVESSGDASWFGARVTSDSVRAYQGKRERLRREIDRLERDLRIDEHPSYQQLPDVPPGSLMGFWRDQLDRDIERAQRADDFDDFDDLHGERVVVWVALASIVVAVVLVTWWLR